MFQKNKSTNLAYLAVIISLLTACSDNDDAVIENNIYEGTFVDSPVEGLNYQCGEASGVTTEAGTFSFQLGDTCTFMLGDLHLGSVLATSTDSAVVSPFDIAEDDEQAIKIASLLQTIDSDGNPENGIDVSEFDSSVLTAELLTANEEAFYQAIFELTGLEAVTFAAAKEHMQATLGEAKGYHSDAIEQVIHEFESVGDIEQLDIQGFLANIHAILDAGDDSNNNDIKSLKAIISIYEIFNDPRVQTRLNITDSANNYTEFLPQIINASMHSSEIILNEATGTSEDVSQIFFEFSSRLVAASDALAISFADVNYVANYGESFSLTAEDVYSIQVSALGTASLLSYFSAYNYGSDEYYIPQAIVQDIEVIEVIYKYGNAEREETYKTITAESSFTAAEINPAELYLDENFMRLHPEEKYLALAKESLIKALQLGKTLLLIKEPDLNADEKQQALDLFDNYLNNLLAENGSVTPVILGENSKTDAKLNLQAMYSVDTALDRDDYIISANIDCGNGEYSEVYSKYMNKPMCVEDTPPESTNILFWDTETEIAITFGEESTTRLYISAKPANVETSTEPLSPDFFKRIVLECTRTQSNGTTEDCNL